MPWTIAASKLQGDGHFISLQKHSSGFCRFVLGESLRSSKGLRDYPWLQELQQLRNEAQTPCLPSEIAMGGRAKTPQKSPP